MSYSHNSKLISVIEHSCLLVALGVPWLAIGYGCHSVGGWAAVSGLGDGLPWGPLGFRGTGSAVLAFVVPRALVLIWSGCPAAVGVGRAAFCWHLLCG